MDAACNSHRTSSGTLLEAIFDNLSLPLQNLLPTFGFSPSTSHRTFERTNATCADDLSV